MAVWKGHSFNTISGREAEKFSGKDSGKGDSDFNDSDSDISGDALKKDLINHMQSGEGSSFTPGSVPPSPRPAPPLLFAGISLLHFGSQTPDPRSPHLSVLEFRSPACLKRRIPKCHVETAPPPK